MQDFGPPMSALGQKQTCAAHKPMSAKCQYMTSVRIGVSQTQSKRGGLFDELTVRRNEPIVAGR